MKHPSPTSSTPSSTRGLTLIELMVTLAILSVVAAIAIPAYTGYITTSKQAECQNEVNLIRLAEEEHFLENRQYFTGGNIGALDGNSDFYTPSAAPAGGRNCTYAVTSGDPTSTYTVTATGTNDLAGEGVIVTMTK